VRLLKPFCNQLKHLKFSLEKHAVWEWLIVLAAASFSVWLMFSTFSYQQGQFIISSKIWSDFAAHLPLIRSFSLGENFPPQYPQFANEPIRYHYLFYLLVGYLEKAGFNLALALNWLSAAGMLALLLAIYSYAKLFARQLLGLKKQAAIGAGFLALILFLFNGSLTFVSYFQEAGWSWQSLLEIFSLTDFINFGPWSGDLISAFWTWNIYTNQRHLAFSFAVSLWLIWPLVKAEVAQGQSRLKFNFWQMLLLWIGLMLLPFLNLAVFVMTVIFIGLWLFFNPQLIKSLAPWYLIGLFFALPSFWYYWKLSGNGIQFKLGYLAESQALIDILQYWWHNLGLYLVLWPLLFLISRPKIKKWLLIFSVYFLLANTWQLSTDMINNHKLINFFQIGLVISLVPVLVQFWQKNWFSKLAVVLLLLPLTFSGVIDAVPVINDRSLHLKDPAQQELGQWLQQQIEPNSVVVTTQYLYNPANLVGRKTYLDYGYFAWSLGYDDRARRKNLQQIFSPLISRSEWCQLAAAEKFDYVLISPGRSDLDLPLEQSWLLRENSNTATKFEGYQLFEVAQVCLEAH
jgi:hypothetical protein